MDVIACTAGHIDHGKTALVKALTGVDADRLPEEKRRGITIDLGFAELDLDGVHIGFVDVPGHERFVKNMLAGAGGIDIAILVVAADEGVMPQTREHFQICRLLGTHAGVIALTKTDLADPDLIEIAKLDIAELVEGSFLENAPVIEASALNSQGIDDLRNALRETALTIPARSDDTVTRLPIDRSFTVRGFGTVVTGTLVSGEITIADEMELMPHGEPVRVRGVQAHGQPLTTVTAGRRVAVNLGGIDHNDVHRGMVLAEKRALRPTQAIDVEIEVLKDAKPLKSRQRVRVHIGTVEMLARVQVLEKGGEIEPGDTGLAQLRLEAPTTAIPGDRFIIRSYSPQITIAGGRVLDVAARRHRGKGIEAARTFLGEIIEFQDKQPELIAAYINRNGETGATIENLQPVTGWTSETLQAALGAAMVFDLIVMAEDYFVSRAHFDALKTKTLAAVTAHHKREPLSSGLSREILREQVFRHISADVFNEVTGSLEKSGDIVREIGNYRLVSHKPEITGDEKRVLDRLRTIYTDAGLAAPKLDEALEQAAEGMTRKPAEARKLFQLLVNSGELVKINEEFYFTAKEIDALIEKLTLFAAATSNRLIDVPKFKDIASISRKYAIPLLEYFDRTGITKRSGDERLIPQR